MNTHKPLPILIPLVLMLAVYVMVLLAFAGLPEIFETWEAKAVDRLFVARSGFKGLQPDTNDAIVHVDLNHSSIQQLQTYFPDRSYHARVIANLAAMGVSAQLFDFIFAARLSPAEDEALIHAARDAGNVYFGMAFEIGRNDPGEKSAPSIPADIRQYLDNTCWKIERHGNAADLYKGKRPLITFPELAAASAGTGFLNLTADRDGAFRRVPLLVRYEDAFYPSIAFRTICALLKVPPAHIQIKPGDAITLKGAGLPGTNHTRDLNIPIDTSGRMIVNFIGPWERMTHYNYADVLHAADDRDEMEMWQDELAGKIAVISEVATGAADVGPVPTDAHYPLSGIHANVMHTILSGAFIREFPPGLVLVVELVLIALIWGCATCLPSTLFIIATAAIALVYTFSWVFLFMYGGLILPVVRPLLITFFCLAALTAYRYIKEEKEKALLRTSFEAYFPPTVVKRLVADPGLIASGGQKKELTVLFSDIVGFTRLTSQMEPAGIQLLLNRYFKEMTDIVFTHEGTVDKFMGDGLLAFFGDPEDQPDHALRCVAAARDMQRKVGAMADTWKALAGRPIRIRIGINTGAVIVGNMGSPKRLSYTVIGSAVNLAQRLESSAPEGGIFISRSTYEQVRDTIDAQPEDEISVKGFDNVIAVYTVPV